MGSSLDATASLADGTAGKEGSSDARTEGTVAVPTLQDIFQQHVEHAMKEPKSLVKGGSFLINTVSSENAGDTDVLSAKNRLSTTARMNNMPMATRADIFSPETPLRLQTPTVTSRQQSKLKGPLEASLGTLTKPFVGHPHLIHVDKTPTQVSNQLRSPALSDMKTQGLAWQTTFETPTSKCSKGSAPLHSQITGMDLLRAPLQDAKDACTAIATPQRDHWPPRPWGVVQHASDDPAIIPEALPVSWAQCGSPIHTDKPTDAKNRQEQLEKNQALDNVANETSLSSGGHVGMRDIAGQSDALLREEPVNLADAHASVLRPLTQHNGNINIAFFTSGKSKHLPGFGKPLMSGAQARPAWKTLAPSEDSLAKARRLLDVDEENVAHDVPMEDNFAENPAHNVAVEQVGCVTPHARVQHPTGGATIGAVPITRSGFSTGKGREIAPSAENIQRASEWLNADKEAIDRMERTSDVTVTPAPSATMTPFGFSTAKGKKIEVSEETLKKTKAWLDEVPASPTSRHDGIDQQQQQQQQRHHDLIGMTPETSHPPVVVGFSTGKGKSISISEKSRQWAELFFDDGNGSDGDANGKKSSSAVVRDEHPIAVETRAEMPSVERPSSFQSPHRSLLLKKTHDQNASPFQKDSNNIEKPKDLVMVAPKKDLLNSPPHCPTSPIHMDKVLNTRPTIAQYFKSLPHPATGSLAIRRPDVDMRGALESFRFSASVVLAAELDLSRGRDDGWGAEEARRDLVRCGAVEKWISLEWIKNHFQWIIWKLASYEYNFPETKDAFMKPTVVLKQLLYRYEREIIHSQRSAIRKILERDDMASRHMVLCVVESGVSGHENELILTDGWYTIHAVIDNILKKAVTLKRICTGMKLHIVGAQLNGSSEAIAALDYAGETKLNLCANQVRRARWDARLGYQSTPAFLRSLHTINPEGGMVPLVDVVIVKRYPVRFLEAISATHKQTRSLLEEEDANKRYEDQFMTDYATFSQLLEQRQAKKPFEAMSKKTMTKEHLILPEVRQLYDECCTRKTDPAMALSRLEELKQRKVTTYVRMKIANVGSSVAGANGSCRWTDCFLIIWRPAEWMLSELFVGRHVKFFCVRTCQRKETDNQLHLSMNGSTQCTLLETMSLASNLHVLQPPLQPIGTNLHDLKQGKRNENCELDLVVVVCRQEWFDESSGRLFVTDPTRTLGVVQFHLSPVLKKAWIKHFEKSKILCLVNVVFKLYDIKYQLVNLTFGDYTEVVQPAKIETLRQAAKATDGWLLKHLAVIDDMNDRVDNVLAGVPPLGAQTLLTTVSVTPATKGIWEPTMNLPPKFIHGITMTNMDDLEMAVENMALSPVYLHLECACLERENNVGCVAVHLPNEDDNGGSKIHVLLDDLRVEALFHALFDTLIDQGRGEFVLWLMDVYTTGILASVNDAEQASRVALRKAYLERLQTTLPLTSVPWRAIPIMLRDATIIDGPLKNPDDQLFIMTHLEWKWLTDRLFAEVSQFRWRAQLTSTPIKNWWMASHIEVVSLNGDTLGLSQLYSQQDMMNECIV